MLIEMVRLMAAEHWNAVRHNNMPVDSAVSTFSEFKARAYDDGHTLQRSKFKRLAGTSTPSV